MAVELLTEPKTDSPALRKLLAAFRRARPVRPRSMLRFAEADIVLPDGPFEGHRFKASRQPFAEIWFRELDEGQWIRAVALGPTQTGKTLIAFVIPALYHLFELQETVILGAPSIDICEDKWREDLEPVIATSRFRELLPRRGSASRGGLKGRGAIQFRHGPTLRFMTGGGDDKSRAAFTSRVLLVTETDGMDRSSSTSKEADKISQLEARTDAYGDRRRIYMECTVSVEKGRTWREYTGGTESRIVLPCPHCGEFVLPERDEFSGWQNADTLTEAQNEASFHCPECGELWSDDERDEANRGCRLLHRGQEIAKDGVVQGEAPDTDTLGFRWTATHNLFFRAKDIAAKEWRAQRDPDPENAERGIRQFLWALPLKPQELEETPLDPQAIVRRVSALERGVVPQLSEHLSGHIDLGKYRCHWSLVAWLEGATPRVVDYGTLDVPQDRGTEEGILYALREFRDRIFDGWPLEGGSTIVPDQFWVDGGKWTHVVYRFVRESREWTGDKAFQRFYPAFGRGQSQMRKQSYTKPKQTNARIVKIGEEYHFSWVPDQQVFHVEVNADYWKTWAFQRLTSPPAELGSMLLFAGEPVEHLTFAKHITAEKQIEEYIPERQTLKVVWKQVSRDNHYLDTIYNACAAGHFCGARLIDKRKVEEAPPDTESEETTSSRLTTPDGRPYMVTERE